MEMRYLLPWRLEVRHRVFCTDIEHRPSTSIHKSRSGSYVRKQADCPDTPTSRAGTQGLTS